MAATFPWGPKKSAVFEINALPYFISSPAWEFGIRRESGAIQTLSAFATGAEPSFLMFLLACRKKISASTRMITRNSPIIKKDFRDIYFVVEWLPSSPAYQIKKRAG